MHCLQQNLEKAIKLQEKIHTCSHLASCCLRGHTLPHYPHSPIFPFLNCFSSPQYSVKPREKITYSTHSYATVLSR